jgi:hypothetical protein
MVMPERETDDLVTGAQAGNSEDFAMLVQRFERQIYAFSWQVCWETATRHGTWFSQCF